MRMHVRLRGVRAAGLAVGIALLTGSAAKGDDWPQFRGPGRDGQSKETGLLPAFPDAGPPIVWRRPAGDGFSGPVVVGDRLILFHQSVDDELAECLDIHSAKPIWSVRYPARLRDMHGSSGPRATPVIAGDRVVTLGGTGILQCLDFATGTVLWRRDLEKEYSIPESYFGVGSTPLVEGQLLLVNLGSPKDAGLAAFDLATGKSVWTATNDTASYSSPVAATIDDRRYAFFFARSGLHAVDPATGTPLFFLRWRARINASVNAATPIVVDDRVFITASYDTGAALLRVGPKGYETIWSDADTLSCQYDTPVHHQGYLYGVDGRADYGNARLRCIELASGRPVWTREGYGCASILLVDRRLLLLSEQGQLELAEASPSGFRSLGRARMLSGSVRAAPALANGQFYARGQTELVRVDLRATGQ